MRFSTQQLLVAATALPLFAAAAQAQIQQDDLIIGVNSNTTDTFRWVRPSGTTPPAGQSVTPRPWGSVAFLQSVEFDNANQTSHNAQGNLLASNFGNAFTGFEIWQVATNGTGNMTKVWSIKDLTGGDRTDRGGGLSVSPDNSKVAWTNYDGGSVYVMDYNAGNIGAGTGAVVNGERETGFNDLGLSAIATGVTQGSTWLTNDKILAFSGFGELVEIDASVAGGTAGAPAQMSASIVKSGIFSGTPQSTSIVYNPDVSNYIYGVVGFFSGSTTTNKVYVWDTDYNLVAEADVSNVQTAREIALDTQGNLYIGGFGAEIVAVIPDAKDPSKVTNNSAIPYWQNDFYASYSGLDVASSIKRGDVILDNVVQANDIDALYAQKALGTQAPRTDLNRDMQVTQADVDALVHEVLGTNYGDANLDQTVDVSDFQALAANFGAGNGWAQGDFDGNNTVDISDFQTQAANFGATAPAITVSVAKSTDSNQRTVAALAAEASFEVAQVEEGELELIVNTATGELTFVGNNVNVQSWQIQSASGSLIADPDGNSSPWTFYLANTESNVAAANLFGSVLIDGVYSALDVLFEVGGVQDLTFLYGREGEAFAQGGTVTYVPEPASLALLGLGGVLAASRRRRV